MTDLLADLDARGLIHDSTDRSALATRLSSGPVTCYVGFDPTADSLHVGHLLGQVTLRRFQLAGHRPLPLAGGATGMIGDPSGRSEERNLLDADALAHNVARIKGQLEQLLDFSPGPCAAKLVDNSSWTRGMDVLEFLRRVGKHFTVNQMVARDSVRARMASEDGISFTEFSYMLLQAHDFAWLCEHEGCELQMGGSDQWGNIVAGIDLIRRTLARTAHGLTWPLLLKSDGTKFGKTAGGAVWLDPAKTSPYQFRQFWVQADDADVERYLAQFTFLPVAEVAELMVTHRAAPERRAAQRLLASTLTAMVHGDGAARAADAAAEVLFGADPATAPADALGVVAAEVGSVGASAGELGGGLGMVDVLVRTGLASSNGDARRTLGQGGVYVNGRRVGPEDTLTAADLVHGRWALVRRGKTNFRVLDAVSG